MPALDDSRLRAARRPRTRVPGQPTLSVVPTQRSGQEHAPSTRVLPIAPERASVTARRAPLPQVTELPAVPYRAPRRAVAPEQPSPRAPGHDAEPASPRVRLLLLAMTLIAVGTALAEHLFG